MKELLDELKRKNERTLSALKKEFGTVRTGRASLSLLDGITVDYYGSQTPLNQVASLSIPEPRMIIIQPWDPKVSKEIEKAVLKSDLGLTPVNDGRVVKVPIPALTEERRRQLVKVVKRMAEECKVAIRNGRRECNEQMKKKEKEGVLAEDDYFKSQGEVQTVTDEYIKRAEQMLESKESEIMEV